MFPLNLSFNPLYVQRTAIITHYQSNVRYTPCIYPPICMLLRLFWRFLQGCSLSHSDCTLLMPQSADAHTANQEYVIF